ncbi:hypothetical protein Pan97_26310 [Bremerella volcania]|uniref:Uncharacterized protein n=1 Tax=Bremerella volcania TaxID=2527984 RepID=A0A518C8P1_9BACT|nr:hypothetical protein Pan97_26310 [Bremerella volcania]
MKHGEYRSALSKAGHIPSQRIACFGILVGCSRIGIHVTTVKGYSIVDRWG